MLLFEWTTVNVFVKRQIVLFNKFLNCTKVFLITG